MQPILTQSAWFRPHNRSEDFENLYFVGAGTHPGAGLPGVLSSSIIVEDLIGGAVGAARAALAAGNGGAMSLQLQPPTSWEATLLDWAYLPLDKPHRPHEHVKTDEDALDAAYQLCHDLTHFHSKTFFAASSLLPPADRRAVRALYAFCRVSDDLVDRSAWLDGDRVEGDTPAESWLLNAIDDRRAALTAWRTLVLDPHPPLDEPVALAWADTRARYHIPDGYVEQLIDGVAHDLDQTRYQSFDDLAAYAYGVASTVGLMAMHIIGFAGSEAIAYAVRLGVALQITNILRDVAEDWANGRLYLPLDELADYGLDEGDIAAGVAGGAVDDRWRDFMRFQIARARRLYDEAIPGIGMLNRDGRFAITAAADLYRAILTDIEAHDYDVFTRRAHVGKWGKIARLPGIWWRSRTV